MMETIQYPIHRAKMKRRSLAAVLYQKPTESTASEEKEEDDDPDTTETMTYVNMIRSLRENDPKFVNLELHGYTVPSSYDPYDLIQALRINKTVRHVEIWKEFLVDLSGEQGRNLFEAIGDLPRCETLFCDFPNPRDGFPLQMHALTCVLTGCSPLKHLSLRNVVLARHEQEVSEALQKHKFLEEFHAKNFLLVNRKITLDPLLQALSAIPTLKIVEIRMKRRQSGALTIRPLRQLCKSKSLLVLKLWQVKLTEELAVLMADALRKNETLKGLTLFDCGLTRNGYEALSHMLRMNSSLVELQLYDEGLDDSCCMAIASGLERNSTLQALTMQPLVPVYDYAAAAM
ncbi:expressed unknown protein [Seminavis robusta]|uniref:Uncharacterized protein n=1 Tax=Seminavis robusta TaxID=568900 RepID=A0A9N8H1N2_9STRA|nr:expressed unknown protein [Seminavis robusta]|eukprot:Sro5_g004710.1 n/a (345) ;mRNA; r:233713-234747